MGKPINGASMQVVAPDFLTGAPANISQTLWMYEWRREQNLTGLSRKIKGLVSQTIDGDRIFNINSAGCPSSSCSSIQVEAMNGIYGHRMTPKDCLTTYLSIDGNRSDVIFVSHYDYLWNSSTSIPHYGINGSDLLVVDDASSLASPFWNSLFFSKGVNTMMMVGFWLDYDWLCGNTNSFDCKFSRSSSSNPSSLRSTQVDDQLYGKMTHP